MVSAKKTEFLFLLFLIWLPDVLYGWQIELIRESPEKVQLIFGQELSVERLLLPTVSKTIWGINRKCRAAVIRIGQKTFLSSANATEDQLLFELEHEFCKEIEVLPVFVENTDQEESGELKLIAISAVRRRIENDIARLASATIVFQKKNNCFSCHTAFPLAVLINEADKKGYEVSQVQIEEFTEHIGSLQHRSGKFIFDSQPDYGTISPTLCAGAIFACLVRFDKRLLVNLNRIFKALPDWQEKTGELKSDFYFKPLFVGNLSSALFESVIIASLYYYAPVITGEQPSKQLLERLTFLNKTFYPDLSGTEEQNLILFLGLPYLGQFEVNMAEDFRQSFERLFAQKTMAENVAITGIAALFFDKLLDTKNLNRLASLLIVSTDNKEKLSNQIWACLVKVLLNEP